MKIGLVSDVHAAPAPLAEAIEHCHAHEVDRIICAGDIAGYNTELSATIDLLIEHRVECIIGNHDESWLTRHEDNDSRDHRFLAALPKRIDFEAAGLKISVVHAELPDATHGGIKILDINGEPLPERIRHWDNKLSAENMDVLIVGHTHQVFSMQLGAALVVNPGSSVFNHSCMILDLPSCEVQTIALSDQQINPVWNWGMQVQT